MSAGRNTSGELVSAFSLYIKLVNNFRKDVLRNSNRRYMFYLYLSNSLQIEHFKIDHAGL